MEAKSDNLKVLKLTSGETIVGKIYFNKETPFLKVEDPVQFTMMWSGSQRCTLVASKWVETDETSFNIPMHTIVATASPNDMLRDYYCNASEDIKNTEFLEDEDNLEDLAELWLESKNRTIH